MTARHKPVWLLPAVIIVLHERLIAEFGGVAGVRDMVLLNSALERPRNMSAYGKPSLYELAAVTFLERNGKHFRASEEESTIRMLGLVTGEVSEKAFAEWLKSRCERIELERN